MGNTDFATGSDDRTNRVGTFFMTLVSSQVGRLEVSVSLRLSEDELELKDLFLFIFVAIINEHNMLIGYFLDLVLGLVGIVF